MIQKIVVPISRIAALIHQDVRMYRQTILIGIGASMLILLTVSGFAASARSDMEFHHLISFPILYLLGGIMVTSIAFSDMHHPRKGVTILALPASRLEKLIARFILTLPAYTLAMIPFYALFLVLSRIINRMLFDHVHPTIHLSSGYFETAFMIYIILHSAFFLGSLIFKRQAFFLTIISLCIAGAIVFGIELLTTQIAFQNMGIIKPQDLRPIYFHLRSLRPVVLFISLTFVLVCWTASLLRMEEIEA